jgi:hypothetical protein
MYADSWEVGDTVVWGFRFTDQLGGAMEQPGDYLISICGTYWLEFENGMVSGPIVSEEPTSIPLEDFATLVDGCLTTGIGAVQAEQGLVAQYIDGAIRIRTTGAWAAAKELVITDARGRSLVSEQLTGDQRAIPWQRGSPAVLVVLLSDGRRTVVQKVLVE